MTRTVHCALLDEELEGLAKPPYPGDLGRRVFDSVSAAAWKKWLAHQTMLINEHRLVPINPDHRKFLETEMEKFFFGDGSAAPDGYVPVDD